MRYFLTIFFTICLFSNTGHSSTIHVPGDFATIQEGIDNAVDGDTVLVADGTYTGDGNRDIDFLGKAIVVKSENGPEVTVVDCEGSAEDQHRGFVFHGGETPDSRLDGLTIRNGYIINLWPGSRGGGIYCEDYSSPTILNCIIKDNYAKEGGGGIFFFHYFSALKNCEISTNSTAGYGGGIYSRYSQLEVSNCLLIKNVSVNGSGLCFINSSYQDIKNCTITGNVASENGGGIYVDQSSFVDITNCVLYDNFPEEIFVYTGTPPIVCYSNIQGGWEGEGNIDDDPLFVDPENDNFHLSPDSPCIDSGTEVDVNDDFDNEPRPMGSGWDIGADEYSPISVFFPNGGEALDIGSTYDIEWNFEGLIESVSIAYSTDSGETWVQMESEYPNQGLYPWIIPDTPSEFCRIKITDSDGVAFDTSDEDFRILDFGIEILHPDGGEVWETGYRETIKWTAQGFDSIRIQLSRYGGEEWETLVEDTPNEGEWEWTVEGDPSDFCLIRISDPSFTWMDTSDSYFQIIPHDPIQRVPDEFSTIQAAIDGSLEGDTVLIADGIYTGIGNKNLDYNGKGIRVTSENGPEFTTIDCEGGGRGVQFHTNEGRGSIMEGFTIQNGQMKNGGGIFCRNASPVIENCFIAGNCAENGGGLYCEFLSAPVIRNCRIFQNQGQNDGGGVYISRSYVNFSETRIDTNSAQNGAGIYCDNSRVILNRCGVSENEASGSGGGIYLDRMYPSKVIECMISNNVAENAAGIFCIDESSPQITDCQIQENISNNAGGGISCEYSSSPHIFNCLIRDNAAFWGAGIRCFEHSHPLIEECDIYENFATFGGGGIQCNISSSPEIRKCILVGNSAEWGGAMRIYDHSSPTIQNCTMYSNYATSGGGISCKYFSTPEIVNCILWNDLPDEILVEEFSEPVVTFSDIEGGFEGEGNIDADPLFIDPDNDDFNLLPDSPCIDAGNPSYPVPYGGGCRIDMGAYEFDKGFNCKEMTLPRGRGRSGVE